MTVLGQPASARLVLPIWPLGPALAELSLPPQAVRASVSIVTAERPMAVRVLRTRSPRGRANGTSRIGAPRGAQELQRRSPRYRPRQRPRALASGMARRVLGRDGQAPSRLWSYQRPTAS